MELQINDEIDTIKSIIKWNIHHIEKGQKKMENLISISLKLHDSINTDIKLQINKEMKETDSFIQYLKREVEGYQIKLDNFNEILLLL